MWRGCAVEFVVSLGHHAGQQCGRRPALMQETTQIPVWSIPVRMTTISGCRSITSSLVPGGTFKHALGSTTTPGRPGNAIMGMSHHNRANPALLFTSAVGGGSHPHDIAWARRKQSWVLFQSSTRLPPIRPGQRPIGHPKMHAFDRICPGGLNGFRSLMLLRK